MNRYIEDLSVRHPTLGHIASEVNDALTLLLKVVGAGGKILVCGNGGSAADALHIVGELMKGFVSLRPLTPGVRKALTEADAEFGPELGARLQRGVPAVSLSESVALTTAVANDIGADYTYAQQIIGLGQPGDVLWGLSTSGGSRNVVAAAVTARALGLKVLSMTGRGPNRLSELSHVSICVPETETFKVQELHLPIYHALCLAVESEVFGVVV